MIFRLQLARATPALPRLSSGYLRDLNANAFWAGITAFIWYAVGLVPVQIAVTGRFGHYTYPELVGANLMAGR